MEAQSSKIKSNSNERQKMQRNLSNQFLTRDESVLVVIDVQEKLVPVINNRDKMRDNIVKLLRFAKIIGLPVVVAEQENLGPTLREIKAETPNLAPLTKIEFNAWKCSQFVERLNQLSRNSIILTGIEAHICIAQTALDLLPRFNVHVVSDAVSSRSRENWDIALQRMRQSGAVITSTEMVIYEILERAGTREFREALGLVK